MSEESVKVAVRVRPFNKRERQREAKLIIEMNGQTTAITNPEDEGDVKKFTFDYSYWSHDGATEQEDGYFAPDSPSSKYIGQKELFNDVGNGILKNAWEGYNTSLFAYGQTGSGKSWSVVGYGANKGLVPQFCDALFEGIQKQKEEGSAAEFEVQFSMLEIYNERVRDLLNPDSKVKTLRVRNHPKKGFYAEGLSIVPVSSYKDIEMRMEEGTQNRTVAATNMNATSSRAHTKVEVRFTQKAKNAAGEETAKVSVVNLIDLAGSERADSTGATGERLKEGAAINQSLSTLGNCIAALADKAQGKKVRVPFRDSVLTMLLKNALGGNSKTVMIAALSPADINFEETLSTLRYADRAKQIKTKATVNEDPTEKLIRDLQEENERLMALLEKAGSGETIGKIDKKEKKEGNEDEDDDDDDDDDDDGLSEEEIKKKVEEELQARLEENNRMQAEMEQKWEERLAEAERKNRERDEAEKKKVEERSSNPHIYNLNPDPMLTGMVVYLLKPGEHKVGRGKQAIPPEIALIGLNIQAEHAVLKNTEGNCTVNSIGDAKVILNGEPVLSEMDIHHGDRILFGSSHLYVFDHPQEKQKLKDEGKEIAELTYEEAQEEMARSAGFKVKKKEVNSDELLVQEDLTDLLPQVEQANGISQELDKKVEFEVVVLSARALGKLTGKKEVYVQVRQLETGYEYLWTRQKFLNRKYVMQEMYEDFQEGEDWNVPPARDPFIESPDTETLIGTVDIYLQCVAYMIELREQLSVTDYRGAEAGLLNIAVVPCDPDGKPIPEDAAYIETPDQLEGKRLDFKIHIESAAGLPKRFTDIYCKYDVFTYENVRTLVKGGTINPEFSHWKQITIDKCSKKVLNFIAEKPVVVEIWGKQMDKKKPVNRAARQGLTTREIIAAQILKKGFGVQAPDKPIIKEDANKQSTENKVMKIQLEKLQSKLAQIRQLCEDAEKKGDTSVLVKELLGGI